MPADTAGDGLLMANRAPAVMVMAITAAGSHNQFDGDQMSRAMNAIENPDQILVFANIREKPGSEPDGSRLSQGGYI